MNERKSSDWKVIIGGILLIIVLFLGIKFVFWGLERAIHKPQTDVSQSVSQSAAASQSEPEESPSFCVHCGKALPESFQWGQFCPWCGEKVEA